MSDEKRRWADQTAEFSAAAIGELLATILEIVLTFFFGLTTGRISSFSSEFGKLRRKFRRIRRTASDWSSQRLSYE